MKKLNVSLLSTVVGSLLLQSALASAAPRFLWSSTEGLQKSTNCQSTSQDQIPFFVVQKNGKFADGILSSSQTGSVSRDSLKEISDSIFEFKDKSLKNDIAGQKLSDTFLQAAFDGDDYAALVCKSGSERKGYVVFNVFAAGQEDAIAQIAVNKNDAQILNTMRVHSVDEATKIMQDKANQALMNGTAAPGSTLTMAGHSSSVIPSSAVAPKLEHGAIVTPAIDKATLDASVAPGTAAATSIAGLPARTEVSGDRAETADTVAAAATQNFVVCSPTADLRVRDQSLTKVLFNVNRLAKIKPLNAFGAGKSAEVSGKSYVFMKVEFTDTQKIGFIAEQMVKDAKVCGASAATVVTAAPVAAPIVAAPVAKPAVVATSSGDANLLGQSCATQKIISAAKTDVANRWGNRPAGRGQCALGVRLSLQRSGVGGVSGGLGNAIDFIAKLKGLGFVDTGIRDAISAPAGAVLVFGGPYTDQYLRNGVMRKPYGNYVGHVTIKGGDGFYYTDGKTSEPAIGWSHNKNVAGRRNLMGVMVPGQDLIQQYAGQCGK